MKLIPVLLLAAFAASPSGASAQADGGINASDIRLTHAGGTVLLEMTLQIDGDAITKCQSIAVIPTLYSGEQAAGFPYVLVNGRKAANIYERHSRFGFAELRDNPPYKVLNMNRRQAGTITVAYSAGLPAAGWTEAASLKLVFQLRSCAGERRYYSIETTAGTVPPPLPPAEPAVTEAPPVKQPEPEPVRISGCAYLTFMPGSYEIMFELGRNAQEMSEIRRVFDKLANTPGAEVTELSITGFASPETPYANNERLAYNRASALADYIRSNYGIPVRDSKISAVPEDWDKLRVLVAASDISHRREILNIIDSGVHPDVKESQLRRLGGGRPWRIMLDDFFPQLRRVEYTVAFVVNR